MRISRGSNFEGYMGFSKITKRDSYYLYRPLIYVTKDEILNYCEKNKIDYATDITNKDDKYTRNRFRKYILPPLKKENPNIHKSFLKLNATIKEYDEYVNKQVSKIINEVYVEGNIIISKFIKEDNIIQKKILITILKEIYKTDINEIKEIHINNIIKILKDKKPNQSINLPKAYILNKSYDKAHIQKEELNKPYDYIIKDDLILPNSHKIKIIKETNDNSNNILKINSKEIKLPLHIRSRKNGDKIEIKGLKGSKKIKDIFIDEKLPKDQRDIYPLVYFEFKI